MTSRERLMAVLLGNEPDRLPWASLIDALKSMSVEETKKYVRQVIADSSQYKGFILSTGDATSYGTPLQNLMAVTEVVHEMYS